MNQPIDAMQIESEIESLRQRLQEAEELRHAISQGEVDAFVVGPNDDSKRVLMLSGAYARYRQLVEEMQQGALTIARSGEVIFANHAFAAMVGLAPADVFRTPLMRYIVPGQNGDAAMLLQPNAGKAEIKAVLKGAGGRQLPVRISLVTGNDDFVTLLVTQRDAQDEEADATVEAIRTGAVDALVVGGEQVVMLDSAQRFYQAAVDRMQQGVVIIGPKTEVTYANQRMAEILGAPRERLAGTQLASFAHPADQSKLASLVAARQGATAQSELRLRRANREYLATLFTVSAMADGQKMCLVTDLSLQKRHEATDERTRKFLGMMAHEFRNILAPIRTSVDVLLRHPGIDAEGRKMVEVIDRQSARLLSLIEDLRRINPRE